MANSIIINHAIAEVKAKSWGVTEQFLDIHSLIYEGEEPMIAHIDRDSEADRAIVYFAVKDEEFFLAVHVQINPGPEVVWVGTEPCHVICFRASSKNLSVAELLKATTLKPTNTYNKGDRRDNRTTHLFSYIEFLPNPEPGNLEDKLRKLLDFLEKDAAGIKKLVELTGSTIQVTSIFHNGNTMLGGLHLNSVLLSRMSALGLTIDFDLYANGNFYK